MPETIATNQHFIHNNSYDFITQNFAMNIQT